MKQKLLNLIMITSRYGFYSMVLQFIFLNAALANDLLAQKNVSVKAIEINMDLRGASLKKAFAEIEKVTNLNFSYDEKILDPSVRVSFNKKGYVSDLLLEISSKAKLHFKQINQNIHVRPLADNKVEQIEVIIQEVNITGRVTTLDGDGLPGVSVVVEGASIGTLTDINGNYQLTAPDNAVLSFSSIGFLTEKIDVNNQSVINVTLIENITELNEVIVVGYGTVRKSDLTGSVSSVKAEQLTAYPAISGVQALQGRAAGVQITANNGEPGAAFKVRIRGGTSINASSDPIYVVDGFVGAVMPPPEDIQSIEILKDASATAIYGSRGANGVILVTTKRGQSGKARIEFNSSYTSQNEISRLDLLNAEQFIDYVQDARPTIQPMGADTDWQDEIFRTGGIQNHQLSVSGGTDNVNYYISGSYFDQEGVVIGSEYKRFSLTSNLDVKASDRLKLGMNLFVRSTDRDGVSTQEGSGGGNTTGVISGAFKFEPDQPVRDANGRFTIARLNDPHDNPYAVATERENSIIDTRIQANMYAEYQIVDNLSFRTTVGAATNNERNATYIPLTLNAGRNVGGEAGIDTRRRVNLLNENYLTYDKTIFGNHNLTLMGGYSYQYQMGEDVGADARGFGRDNFSYWNLGAGSTLMIPSSGYFDQTLKSYYSRLNYSIGDKYSLSLNARYDGSSNFSENNKWAFFPSGAFAWNMGNEQFMSNISQISNFKWRVSYGLTGNQAINSYQTLARLSNVLAVHDGEIVNAYRPTNVANNELKWETTTQLNLGLDIGLFQDRFNITADVYRMVTSDLLFNQSLPWYTGFANMTANIGQMENKGIELMLSAHILTGAFKWTTDFNISANRNQILKLPDGEDQLHSNGPGHFAGLGTTTISREGYPVGSFFGWIYDGVYQEGDEFLPGSGFEQAAGGEKFRDIDGTRDAEGELTGEPDGRLDANDRTIIGNPHPDFIWGWSNDFTWKNFDLNIFFQGSQGNDILSFTMMELDLLSGINNATTNALNRWTPENTNTDVPSAFNGRTRRTSTRFIYDGSFVRLKNISLGYNLPKAALDRMKINRLRIYVSAQNLLTFTKYEGYDPEVNYNSGGSGANSNRNLGLDYGSYPLAKGYTVGINVGF